MKTETQVQLQLLGNDYSNTPSYPSWFKERHLFKEMLFHWVQPLPSRLVWCTLTVSYTRPFENTGISNMLDFHNCIFCRMENARECFPLTDVQTKVIELESHTEKGSGVYACTECRWAFDCLRVNRNC